ncbi:MAG: hypothetical protein AB7U51_12475 [Arcobacter sp.]|uniref:hypothetical protein n=1 Tax=Arcobacter sp. TaxID=1872629 RepID=UPI003CFDDFEA
MCKKENIENKIRILGKNLSELSALESVFKSLCRSIEFNDYSNEKVSINEIVDILRKQNNEFKETLLSAYDGIDELSFEFDKFVQENQEDKIRLARTIKALIGNGDLEKVQKELDNIITSKQF